MADSTKDAQLDKKEGREILGLKVKEVSLVDKPAILREFLVVKRQEEESMGAFESDPQTPSTSAGEVVEKALPKELSDAIKIVSSLLTKQANVEGAPKDDISRVVALLGKVAAGQYPEPASKAKKEEDMTDEEKKEKEQKEKEEKEKAEKAKADKDKADKDKEKEEEEKKAAKAAICAGCGGEMKEGVCVKCGAKVAAASDEKEADTAKGLSITIAPDGAVTVSGEAINKAGKSQFTSERTTALKSSVSNLFTMLAGVDEEAAKAIIEDLTKKVLPGNVKWTSGTSATPASVKKAVEEVMAPLVEKQEETNKRLEDIEKTRPAPKSEDGDGDGEKVQKNDSPWKDLPLG